MNVDTRLRSYWAALRGLRRAADREGWLEGPFKLAITLEKDPRLRARLIQTYEEQSQRKPA